MSIFKNSIVVLIWPSLFNNSAIVNVVLIVVVVGFGDDIVEVVVVVVRVTLSALSNKRIHQFSIIFNYSQMFRFYDLIYTIV